MVKLLFLKNQCYIPMRKKILYLVSVAPSGHNTETWFIKYIKPHNWIICNNKTKWLSCVDLKNRRIERSNCLNDLLKKEDAVYLFNEENDFFHFMQNGAKEFHYVNEQTI